ncbi:MAG: GNA1162 family protein [Anaeromyxobacteraceae bacterium]
MTRSHIVRLLTSAALALIATGCVAPRKDYAAFIAANPKSILAIPVLNNTVNVDAPDYFLSTLPVPLAERGYYVFPVNLVKRLLEDEGLADAGLVHRADPAKLAALFGADALLYVTIQKWEAKWILIQTNVTVEFDYVLKDAKTGTVIWKDHETMEYSSNSNNSGGLIGAIVSAAVAKAAPDYMPLARRANAQALAYPGPGFPAGPYRPEYQLDYPKAETQQQPPPAQPMPPQRAEAR